jgi:hypothetical protein
MPSGVRAMRPALMRGFSAAEQPRKKQWIAAGNRQA